MANSIVLHRNTRKPPSPPSSSTVVCCEGSSLSAAIDVMFLTAVITSSTILIFPYIRFISLESISILHDLSRFLKREIARSRPDHYPIVCWLIVWSVSCAALSLCMIVLILCSSGRGRRCGKASCRGLGRANAEFDIQLESEDGRVVERVRRGVVSKMGLFEVRRDRHQLEAELKKMAPANGRAVLVFRGRCGCSVGRLVVPGPKVVLQQRKIKK